MVLPQEALDWTREIARQRNEGAGAYDHKYGCDPANSLTVHELGTAGEWVVSEHLGVPWPARVGNYKEPDIGVDIQVRARSKHWMDLLIRPDDDPSHRYVLVTGVPTEDMRVRGWIRGTDARRPEWWKNHGNRGWAWFVPQSELLPIRERIPA